jgi:hypothetical protein
MWYIVAVSREIEFSSQENDIFHFAAETEEALLELFQDFVAYAVDEGEDDWDVLKEAIEDGYFVKGPFQS